MQKINLPFNVEKIEILETNIGNDDVVTSKIVYINDTTIEFEDSIDCIYDAGGYTQLVRSSSFPWSFNEIKNPIQPYILITLK